MIERPIVDAAVKQFEEQGYCVLPSLLAGDVTDRLNDLTDSFLTAAREVEGETSIYDVDEGHTAAAPRVRRIKKPHELHADYRQAAADERLLLLLTELIGENIRLHHSKINTKQALVGTPLEWHQDWAFIPHTNQSLAIASLMLDSVDDDNGPMLAIPGSHRLGLLNHHDRAGYFTGAINPDDPALRTDQAIPITGPKGTVTLHHPLLIHGSAPNRGSRRRHVLFFEYAATDAWPLFYGVQWEEYTSRVVCGSETHEPRLEPCFVRMGYPRRYEGSIYANQQAVEKKYFS